MPLSSLLTSQPINPQAKEFLDRLKGLKMATPSPAAAAPPIPGPAQGAAPGMSSSPSTDGTISPPSQPSATPALSDMQSKMQANQAQIQALQAELSKPFDLNQAVQQQVGSEQDFLQNQWANSKYNPQGKGGKAVSFLTDFLRSIQRQPTMQQAIMQSARADYQNAVKDQAQQIQADRNQKTSQLSALRLEQQQYMPIIQKQLEAEQQLQQGQKIWNSLSDADRNALTPVQKAQIFSGKQITEQPFRQMNAWESGKDLLARDPNAHDLYGNPIDKDSTYRIASINGQMGHVPDDKTTKNEIIKEDPPGSGKFRKITQLIDQTGHVRDEIDGGIIPSQVPTQTTVNGVTMTPRLITTRGPNGENIQQFVMEPSPTTRSTTRGPATTPAPLPPTPPGQPPVGSNANPLLPQHVPPQSWVKPPTPAETQKLDSNFKMTSTTLGIAQRVVKNLPEIQDMIQAGKIAYVSEPEPNGMSGPGLIHMVVSRGVNLTPAQAQMASDFSSLAEGINVIRLPLGGGGFRGPLAWSALQGMRGDPRNNVDVTKGILMNTMKFLSEQQASYAKALGKIKVRDRATGANGYIDSGDFSQDKYERVQ